MFGADELKGRIEITESTVECPVKGCRERVERQRQTFKKEERFRCPEHNIFISPSTFEYQSDRDNLLWKEGPDQELLRRIMGAKRESRMARDNSEDAVSWNVFRFLERNGLTEEFLSSVTGTTITSSEVIYWSYSQKETGSWSLLDKARQKFGEQSERGSEPDIIIKTNNALFFIEAKLTAGNETEPSNKNDSKKYETGGEGWYSRVFKCPYRTVALKEKKYELLRFWLLGTWMAQQQDLHFYLINLVLSERETDIQAVFEKLIDETERRKFMRITWEHIYRYILSTGPAAEKDVMLRFFRTKTIGYDGKGNLRPAFSIPRPGMST